MSVSHETPTRRATTVRFVVTQQDIDAFIAKAEQVYPDRGFEFDRAKARQWLLKLLDNGDAAIFMTAHGGGVCIIVEQYWGGPRRAHLIYLFAAPNNGWEGYRIVKAMDKWRRERGAESFHFGADTDAGVDLSPIAKRLGAIQEAPTYRIVGGRQKRSARVVQHPAIISDPGRLSVLEQALGRSGARVWASTR